MKGGAIGFYKKGGRTHPVHAKTGMGRTRIPGKGNPHLQRLVRTRVFPALTEKGRIEAHIESLNDRETLRHLRLDHHRNPETETFLEIFNLHHKLHGLKRRT